MPELAEVEHFRRRWDVGIGEPVEAVEVHAGARVFRGTDVREMRGALVGTDFRASWAHGKQMLFQFGDDRWLGVHLGMSGELRVEPGGWSAGKHDHLVLRQSGQALVFTDPRMFGRVRFEIGEQAPGWWREMPLSVLDRGFTRERMVGFLARRARAPVKAVLLDQSFFPGVGNWMADEILWRAGVHPACPCGMLEGRELASIYRALRFVAREALRMIGEKGEDPPEPWLFPHRWSDGGICPRTGVKLMRIQVGGRTSCYSPARQRLPGSARG